MGQLSRTTEVDKFTEYSEIGNGEILFTLRDLTRAASDSLKATAQGRHGHFSNGHLDTTVDVEGRESSDVSTDGCVGIFTEVQPGGIADEKTLRRRCGSPFEGQEKPKKGPPGTLMGGSYRVCGRSAYTRASHEGQVLLIRNNVCKWSEYKDCKAREGGGREENTALSPDMITSHGRIPVRAKSLSNSNCDAASAAKLSSDRIHTARSLIFALAQIQYIRRRMAMA